MSKGVNQKISELYMLTNQMRLELGQLRKREQPNTNQKSLYSTKKHFTYVSNPPTEVFSPLEPNSKSIKPHNKRHYNNYVTLHQQFNSKTERKHFL